MCERQPSSDCFCFGSSLVLCFFFYGLEQRNVKLFRGWFSRKLFSISMSFLVGISCGAVMLCGLNEDFLNSSTVDLIVYVGYGGIGCNWGFGFFCLNSSRGCIPPTGADSHPASSENNPGCTLCLKHLIM